MYKNKKHDIILHRMQKLEMYHEKMTIVSMPDKTMHVLPVEALIGYDYAVVETARLTNRRIEPTNGKDGHTSHTFYAHKTK